MYKNKSFFSINFFIFVISLHSKIKWSVCRVARQRSAKPCTPVRIRYRPQKTFRAAKGFFNYKNQ